MVVVERRQDLNPALPAQYHRRDSTGGVVRGKLLAAHFQSKVGALLDEIMDDPTHRADCFRALALIVDCSSPTLLIAAYLCLLLGTHLSGYVRDQTETYVCANGRRCTRVGNRSICS